MRVRITTADANKRFAIPVNEPRISWDEHTDHICEELVVCYGINAHQYRDQIDFAELWHMVTSDLNWDALALLICRHGMAITDLPQFVLNRMFVITDAPNLDGLGNKSTDNSFSPTGPLRHLR
jgi:hypothetical protein